MLQKSIQVKGGGREKQVKIKQRIYRMDLEDDGQAEGSELKMKVLEHIENERKPTDK